MRRSLVFCALVLLGCKGGDGGDGGPDADAPEDDVRDVTGETDAFDVPGDGDVAVEPDAGSEPAPLEGIHVARDGTDSETCGDEVDPCLTIRHGIDMASPRDNVLVHAGTYEESWIQIPSHVSVISVDGPLEAVIDSGDASAVRFDGVMDAVFDGFEVHGNLNGGSPGDGLIRVLDSDDITVRNGVFHDAPADQDVIKVSGRVSGLRLENIVAYNPAERTGTNPCGSGPWYQENIDIFGSGATSSDPPPVSDVVVRGCWLFHTSAGGDWLIYSKINAENIMYENNVFGPSAGGGCGNAAVGIGTGEPGQPDATAAVVRHGIVRNNIFVGLRGDAAFAIMNSDDTWVYSNTFYRNSGTDLRSVIMIRGNSHQPVDAWILGNVFVGNQPSMGGAVFYWERDALAGTFVHDHNLYLDNISATDVAVTGEPHSLFGSDPGFASAAVPDISTISLARIAGIVAGFEPGSGSPVADEGPDVVGMSDHPIWSPEETGRRWDIEGAPRPPDDTWDLGTHEISP